MADFDPVAGPNSRWLWLSVKSLLDGGGGGGVTDHGALTGLADDDHAQYLNTSRHGAITGNPHSTTAADLSDFAEAVDDRVAALLTAGSNITLTYNDASGTLTIAASGGGSGGITSGSATIDFGASETDTATVSVALPAVSATSEIVIIPRYSSALTDHDPEDYAIEGINAVVGAVTAGVGFDVHAWAPNGTWGQYNIDYMVTA